MSIPTKGEEFDKLLMHIRKAQEHAAMLAHLHADESSVKSHGWLTISENLKRMCGGVQLLMRKGLQ